MCFESSQFLLISSLPFQKGIWKGLEVSFPDFKIAAYWRRGFVPEVVCS